MSSGVLVLKMYQMKLFVPGRSGLLCSSCTTETCHEFVLDNEESGRVAFRDLSCCVLIKSDDDEEESEQS
jgi:hypothetical protein